MTPSFLLADLPVGLHLMNLHTAMRRLHLKIGRERELGHDVAALEGRLREKRAAIRKVLVALG